MALDKGEEKKGILKRKRAFSVDNEDTKEHANIKEDVQVDNSSDIIDIMDTPDVATWNKEIQKGNTAGKLVNRADNLKASISAPTSIGIGLRAKNGHKRDSIIDPADKNEIDEVIQSGSTLTDKANLS